MSCASEYTLSPRAGQAPSNLHQPRSPSQAGNTNSQRQVSVTLAESPHTVQRLAESQPRKNQAFWVPKVELSQILWPVFLPKKLGGSFPRASGTVCTMFICSFVPLRAPHQEVLLIPLEADGTSNIYLTAQAKNLGTILNHPTLLATSKTWPPPASTLEGCHHLTNLLPRLLATT